MSTNEQNILLCKHYFIRKKPSDPVTIESVKENWSNVVDMNGAVHVDKIADVTVDLVQKLQVCELVLELGLWYFFLFNLHMCLKLDSKFELDRESHDK